MTKVESFHRIYSQLFRGKEDLGRWEDFALLQLTESLERLMVKPDGKPLSQRELADKAGVSQPLVNRWLRGEANMELRSMVRLARALKAVLYVHAAPEDVAVDWTESGSGEAEENATVSQAVRESRNAALGYSLERSEPWSAPSTLPPKTEVEFPRDKDLGLVPVNG